MAAFHAAPAAPGGAEIDRVTGSLRVVGDRARMHEVAQRICAEAGELQLNPGMRSIELEVHLGVALCRALAEQPALSVAPTDEGWPALADLGDEHLASVGRTVAECVAGELPEANPWSFAYLWSDERTARIPSQRGIDADRLPGFLVNELVQAALREPARELAVTRRSARGTRP
jgi:hypothetical protein